MTVRSEEEIEEESENGPEENDQQKIYRRDASGVGKVDICFPVVSEGLPELILQGGVELFGEDGLIELLGEVAVAYGVGQDGDRLEVIGGQFVVEGGDAFSDDFGLLGSGLGGHDNLPEDEYD